MKVVFGTLTGLISELKMRGQQEVREMRVASYRNDPRGVGWTTRYSLVTAEITRGTFGVLRVGYGYGTTTQPLVSLAEDKPYQALWNKADRGHREMERRLTEAGLTVLASAYRSEAESIEGTLD